MLALLAGALAARAGQAMRANRAARLPVGLGVVAVLLALLVWAPGELAARELRFAAGNGPGGSLWRLAGQICAIPPADRPQRMLLVDPPIAQPHAEAIVQLACAGAVEPVVVSAPQVEAALKERTVVIDFPGGSAQVAQWK
jgi:hypothetical protein